MTGESQMWVSIDYARDVDAGNRWKVQGVKPS